MKVLKLISTRAVACGLAGVALALLAGVASAQQQPAASPALPAAAAEPGAASGERYRIGPGDVLDIRVFNKPQFSRDGVQVGPQGSIRMPYIEGEIGAACRTEAELAADVTARLREYLRSPQVDVFIREYKSQPIAVIGAVRAPSRFQLQRSVRLLELLSSVGGPADNAGRNIQVVHSPGAFACEDRAAASAAPADEVGGVDYFDLSETLRGVEKSNPFVRPGDVISIPEADQVYIVGNVLKPSALSLREPITLTRAIAMAGGTLTDTKKDRVRIVRQAPGSLAKTEIIVDLKAIDRRQAEDVALQANDIIDVPTSGGKRILRSLIGAIVPSVGQLPVRVIP